ncbi:MAG: DUF2802 domain-containing protein [Vogesella sp.]|uniref:DUF2802 domain-containing protein n=1 Tax=Vogesella sp. TaxID=1904252 RepID=UPI003F385B2D
MNTTDWLLFLIVVLQSGIVFWLWRRIDMIESERRVEASTFDHLQRQISAMQRSLQEASQAKPVEAPLAPVMPARTVLRQQPLATAEGASPYNQAIELFKRGFSTADVAERCGISRSEAELILSLYRNSPTA